MQTSGSILKMSDCQELNLKVLKFGSGSRRL